MDPSGWANLNWRCCECLNGSVGCSIDCWIARDASACLWYRGVQVHGAQLHSYNVVCGTTRSINTYSNNNNKSVTRRVKFHVTVWRYYCNNYIAYTYSGSKLSSYNLRKYVDRMRLAKQFTIKTPYSILKLGPTNSSIHIYVNAGFWQPTGYTFFILFSQICTLLLIIPSL